MSSKPGTAFWRIAGMTYLQYINKAASTMRGALKEPAKRQALTQETFHFNSSLWESGVQGKKFAVDTLKQAGQKQA